MCHRGVENVIVEAWYCETEIGEQITRGCRSGLRGPYAEQEGPARSDRRCGGLDRRQGLERRGEDWKIERKDGWEGIGEGATGGLRASAPRRV